MIGRDKLHMQRRVVAKAVKKAKNEWFQQEAKEIKLGCCLHGGLDKVCEGG